MSDNKAHLLLVDDDKRILSLLSTYLSKNNFLVSSARNSIEARSLLNYFEFDLLIIDIMMPGENGLNLLESIRKQTNVPAIFLSAKGESKDKISGLEIGADDYLSKPFEPKELLLRLERLLLRNNRKSSNETDRYVEIGNKVFDLYRMELSYENRIVKLTNLEISLLKFLVLNPEKTISREMVLKDLNLHQEDKDINQRNVDVQITRLRKKIEQDPKNPRHLKTVRGRGYRFLP
ncbi:MAG: response regulator transcription factor [Pseudomonadota bacterium]|nr:response regulator transcription factor [Pseudomonadota bacterium]